MRFYLANTVSVIRATFFTRVIKEHEKISLRTIVCSIVQWDMEAGKR